MSPIQERILYALVALALTFVQEGYRIGPRDAKIDYAVSVLEKCIDPATYEACRPKGDLCHRDHQCCSGECRRLECE